METHAQPAKPGTVLGNAEMRQLCRTCLPSIFFYSKNLPETPHPLSLRLLRSGQCKYQPRLRTLWDELISIEEDPIR
jgi:hypothetical protein